MTQSGTVNENTNSDDYHWVLFLKCLNYANEGDKNGPKSLERSCVAVPGD
jgi:hypothetical protein